MLTHKRGARQSSCTFYSVQNIVSVVFTTLKANAKIQFVEAVRTLQIVQHYITCIHDNGNNAKTARQSSSC